MANPDELTEQAWAMIEEALSTGVITLPNKTERPVDTNNLIRLVQWLATLRSKKPKLVNAPEDFSLKSTKGDKDAKA